MIFSEKKKFHILGEVSNERIAVKAKESLLTKNIKGNLLLPNRQPLLLEQKPNIVHFEWSLLTNKQLVIM